MLLKETVAHTRVKNRLVVGHCAITWSLCLLVLSLRPSNAATEQLASSGFALHRGNAAQSNAPVVTASQSATTPLAASSAPSSSYQNAGTRTILRIYDECSRADGGFVPCLKKKTIAFIDRISHIDAIAVAEGVKLVRLPGAEAAAAAAATAAAAPQLSDNELESSLSRSSEDRDAKLTRMLIERLSYFFNGHSLQVSFPKLTSDEIGRGLEEGRGKMKKMMGMMMMGMAMKMMGMIPIAMGMLYMLAGKALIISKIALLLAGIIGLKKLMSGRGGSSGGGGGGWSSGGGGGGWSSGGGSSGGYDRRSLNEAHELAYRSYGANRPSALEQKQHKQAQQRQQQKPAALPLQQQQQQQQQPQQVQQS